MWQAQRMDELVHIGSHVHLSAGILSEVRIPLRRWKVEATCHCSALAPALLMPALLPLCRPISQNQTCAEVGRDSIARHNGMDHEMLKYQISGTLKQLQV